MPSDNMIPDKMTFIKTEQNAHTLSYDRDILSWIRLHTLFSIYSVSQKSSPPKTFCYIFTQVKCVSV